MIGRGERWRCVPDNGCRARLRAAHRGRPGPPPERDDASTLFEGNGQMDTTLLGKTVVDTVTGYKGVVTALACYLHGETRVLLENSGGDRWVEQARIEISEN